MTPEITKKSPAWRPWLLAKTEPFLSTLDPVIDSFRCKILASTPILSPTSSPKKVSPLTVNVFDMDAADSSRPSPAPNRMSELPVVIIVPETSGKNNVLLALSLGKLSVERNSGSCDPSRKSTAGLKHVQVPPVPEALTASSYASLVACTVSVCPSDTPITSKLLPCNEGMFSTEDKNTMRVPALMLSVHAPRQVMISPFCPPTTVGFTVDMENSPEQTVDDEIEPFTDTVSAIFPPRIAWF